MNLLKKIFLRRNKDKNKLKVKESLFPDIVSPKEEDISAFAHSYNNVTAWWDNLSNDWKSILLLHSNISKEKKYDLSTIPDEEFFKEIFNRDMFCSLYRPLKSLAPLNNLKKLKELQIELIEVKNFTEVRDLKNVTTIHISNSTLKSLDGLENYDNLEVLTLANTDVTTLKPIVTLEKVIDLDIRGTLINPNEVDLYRQLHPNTNIDFITPMNPLRRNKDSLENPLLDYYRNLIRSDSP